MQITKDIAVFPDNYRSCLSQRQLVAKRIVHSEQQVETVLNNTSTRDTISIHNDYGSKSVLFFY